jgi:rare lipoprotein A
VRFSSFEKISSEAQSEHELVGYASYYADKFDGRKTADGEIFDQSKLTAAHKTLPFGTIVEVVNKKNGLTVTVIINDRGPFVPGRIIDLSYAAASKIGMIQEGVVPVELRIIDQ